MKRSFVALLVVISVWSTRLIRADELCLAIDPCPTDLTGDGIVGMADLSQVLALWHDPENNCWALARVEGNWGPCPTMPGDVNDDGSVDSLDIHALLAAREIDCRVDLDRNKVVDERDLDAWDCLYELGDLETADLNRDGVLNFADQLVVEDAINEQRDCRYDLNGDGEIGWSDVVIVADDEK